METHQNVYIGKYQMLRVLGQGFCGQVRLGRNRDTGELVALKILDKNLPHAEQVKKSIQKEGQHLQKHEHPNIIKLLDYDENATITIDGEIHSENNLYMCLELAPNKEIFDIISETGKFSYNTARYYAKQLILVLKYLHDKNIVHRDLKPENILIGKNYELKLVDFGFVSQIQEGILNQTYLGTPGYKAPEIVNKKQYDAKKADIFAFGVILYILTKGNPPFREANVQKDQYYRAFIVNTQKYWNAMDSGKDLSTELRSLLEGCLAYDQNKRYGIEDILNSDFMNSTINEEQALQDVKQRLQRIQQAHQMQIEEDSDDEDDHEQNFRNQSEEVADEDELYNVSEELMQKIEIAQNVEGCKVCVIVDSNDKQLLMKKIVQTLNSQDEDISINYEFDENTKKIEVEIQKDQQQYKQSIELIQVNNNQLGFSVILKEGDYFTNLQLKKQFCDVFRQKCNTQQSSD